MSYKELTNKVMPGVIYKQDNGQNCDCLAVRGSYAIFNRHTNYLPFVVAWIPKLYLKDEVKEVLCWGQGHYIDTLENAQKLLIEKTW